MYLYVSESPKRTKIHRKGRHFDLQPNTAYRTEKSTGNTRNRCHWRHIRLSLVISIGCRNRKKNIKLHINSITLAILFFFFQMFIAETSRTNTTTRWASCPVNVIGQITEDRPYLFEFRRIFCRWTVVRWNDSAKCIGNACFALALEAGRDCCSRWHWRWEEPDERATNRRGLYIFFLSIWAIYRSRQRAERELREAREPGGGGRFFLHYPCDDLDADVYTEDMRTKEKTCGTDGVIRVQQPSRYTLLFSSSLVSLFSMYLTCFFFWVFLVFSHFSFFFSSFACCCCIFLPHPLWLSVPPKHGVQ